MDIKIGYRIIWILVFTALLVAQPVEAQTEVTRLDRVQVDVWPDYDQAAVLVLISGELPADTALPATVQLEIPAAAGEPNAVARITTDGSMLNTPYQTQSSGDTTLLTVETAELTIRIEYYFPYERNGDAVQFTYRWLGGVAVDELTILFQEPVQATSITTDLGFQEIGIQDNGRRYQQWLVGAVGKDETRAATFSYTASPVNPSSMSLPPADPSTQNQPSILPILIAVIGGVLVGAGIGWFLANRRNPVRQSPRRRKRTVNAAYCRHCGGRIQAGDAHCRQCGAKVR
jgi:hypothetical protein